MPINETESRLEKLTLLQRDIIQRLLSAGHSALAEEALDCWLAGRALESVFLGGDPERRADFDRANAQARRVTT